MSGGRAGRTPRAVFLDAGNTLFRPFPSVGGVYARVAGEHGVRLRPAEIQKRFARAWSRRDGTGVLHGEKEERAWWRGLVSEVFEGCFSSATAFTRFFEELHGVFARPETWRLYADVLPALDRLKKRGLTVGIVSNWDRRLFALCEGLGVTPKVDFILASAVEGTSKPGREIFRRALKRAGVAAREALHVGDSYRDDYLGALGAGLSARLLCRNAPVKRGVKSVRSLRELEGI